MSKRAVLAAAVLLATLLVPTAPAEAAARVNNWTCRTSSAHPYPVIVLHGTYGDKDSVYGTLSSSLLSAGYCVFALNYGNLGTAPVAQSAGQLKNFVNTVLFWTRARKVSIVGHSQGGTMPRYYIKNLGGASKVDDLVGIVPGNHGTSRTVAARLAVPGIDCQACADLTAGSRFLTALNTGDESPGTVSYTNIVSKADTVVVPYTSGYLDPSPNVANLRIQDYCPANRTSHVYAPKDPAFIRFTLDALAHPGPASKTFRPRCTW